MNVVDIFPKDIEVVISFSASDIKKLLNAFDLMTMKYEGTNVQHQEYKDVYEKFYSLLEEIEKGLEHGD